MSVEGKVRLLFLSHFRWFWSSQTLSFVGDRLTGFAVPATAILVLHASSAEVGFLTALGWLAYPVLGLFAGAALVHLRLRPVMITSELVRFAAFATVPVAAAAGWLTITQLFVVVTVAGCATVFTDIAGQSYLPSLVDENLLYGANFRLQNSDSLSKVVGPALAGAITHAFGVVLGSALYSVPFLLSALGRTRIRKDVVAPPHVRSPIPVGIRSGCRFVLNHPQLRWLVCCAALRNFGMGAVDAVLLLFAYRAVGLSNAAGGLLLASGAVGGVFGAVVAHSLIARLGVRRTLLLTGVEGASWIAVPLCLIVAPVQILIAIRMFSSVWLPVWSVVSTSLRQTMTPPEQQSTVHATVRTLVSSTVPLGAVTGGLAASALGGGVGTSAGLVLVLMAGGMCASSGVLVLRRVDWRRTSGRPYEDIEAGRSSDD